MITQLRQENTKGISVLAKKKVKALMVGIRNHGKPDNADWEIYDFYSYHFPDIHEWWMGFVVVNYDVVPVPCNVQMQLKGPATDKITRKAVLQPGEATLFSAKVKLANKVGLYTLIGIMKGSDIGSGKKVTTRFYVYEIW